MELPKDIKTLHDYSKGRPMIFLVRLGCSLLLSRKTHYVLLYQSVERPLLGGRWFYPRPGQGVATIAV